MTIWSFITQPELAFREFLAHRYRPELHYMRGPGPAYARRAAIVEARRYCRDCVANVDDEMALVPPAVGVPFVLVSESELQPGQETHTKPKHLQWTVSSAALPFEPSGRVLGVLRIHEPTIDI